MVSAADRLSAPRLRTGWPTVFMEVHPALTYRDADAGFLTWHSAVLRALKLRTGFAVSSLMLTADPRPGSSASHRYSGRSVEKDRVDHLANRPDPGSVETRLLHDTAA
jgi:hypothetical protein